MIRTFVRGLAACIVMLAAAPGFSQSIPCGEPYTVQRGDTLQRIAVRAYGPDASYRDLIGPNRHVFLRGDPSRLEAGQVLTIPCRGAAAPAPAPDSGGAEATAPAPAEAPHPRPGGPSILFVQTALSGAMGATFAAVRTRSGLGEMRQSETPDDPRRLVAALRAAPRPALATGVPKPACDTEGAATPLCTELVWSAPMGETVLATFTLARSGPVTRDAALAGLRLCTPAGVPDVLLEGRGLIRRGAGLRTAESGSACFTLLRAGEVDAAIMPAGVADAALAALPQGEPVAEQFALAQLVTLHAVALKADAEAVALLERLDAAIAEMRADGSWLALLGGGAD